MTDRPTGDEDRPGMQVLVEIGGCHETDARTVIAALRSTLRTDRGPGDVPHPAARDHPTVWAATVDIGTATPAARPPLLTAPVTLDVQGGYHAVDRLRRVLAGMFRVHVTGTASGDQENEVQLRLESRPDAG